MTTVVDNANLVMVNGNVNVNVNVIVYTGIHLCGVLTWDALLTCFS